MLESQVIMVGVVGAVALFSAIVLQDYHHDHEVLGAIASFAFGVLAFAAGNVEVARDANSPAVFGSGAAQLFYGVLAVLSLGVVVAAYTDRWPVDERDIPEGTDV